MALSELGLAFLTGLGAWAVTGVDDLADLVVLRSLGYPQRNIFIGFLWALTVTLGAGLAIAYALQSALSTSPLGAYLEVASGSLILLVGIAYLLRLRFWHAARPEPGAAPAGAARGSLWPGLSYLLRGLDDVMVYTAVFIRPLGLSGRLAVALGVFAAFAAFVLLAGNSLTRISHRREDRSLHLIGYTAAFLLIALGALSLAGGFI